MKRFGYEMNDLKDEMRMNDCNNSDDDNNCCDDSSCCECE